MSFTTDKQTLDDLGLLGKFKPHSVYALFNKVKTAGGERLLGHMFHHPLCNPDDINSRSAIFSYFHDKNLPFPFTREVFTVVENYLSNGTYNNRLAAAGGTVRKKLMHSFLRDEQYAALQTGLKTTIEALLVLKDFLTRINIGMAVPARRILSDRKLEWLTAERGTASMPVLKLSQYDYLLRHTLRNEMDVLLETVHQLDVYTAVSQVAAKKTSPMRWPLPSSQNVFETAALRHPVLPKAVANPLLLNDARNLIFLTGANMAGKSTLMKSIGIATYLSHMGFPVAAEHMRFSVCDGLYTSINVPDNLDMGYSHFYAEVLRVKKYQEVSSGKKLVVIFDELFKGTNVKDAYDATLAVTRAFSRYRNCSFVISTHIIEVGDALKKEFDSIRFQFLPTIMKGNLPTYPYTLAEGITSDRQGMVIIENEKILELLEV